MDPAREPGTLPVLYVAGMGRSGSTLLERLIGQLPGVCNLGEVAYLFERGIRQDQRCGCGASFRDCPFWTEVGDKAFGGWDALDLDRIALLARTVDDVKYVPQMLAPRWSTDFDRRRAEYSEYFRGIYAAAADVTGAEVIVDSSKRTSLAYALAHEPGISMSQLHLLRDPRGVAHSWTQFVRRPEIADRVEYMPRYSTTYMSALWSGHNVLLAALRLRGVPTSTVTYEQFLADPRATLRAVARFLGLGEVDPDFITPDGGSVVLRPAHSVAGNPMRFHNGATPLRRDTRWRTDMSRGRRVSVTVLTLPAAVAFGYRPWRRSAPGLTPTAATSDRSAAEDGAAAAAEDGAAAGNGAAVAVRLGAGTVTAPDVVVTDWPSVTAVVPSHNRAELLRRAVSAILAQDYPGALDVIVVHDRESADRALAGEFPGRVRSRVNTRTPGLCGARNTGIELADADLVAFCDDDDQWRPGKLRAQVQRMAAEPEAVMAATAMQVNFNGVHTDRRAGATHVTYDMLLVSRMAMLHSSSFLLRRDALLGPVGLLDEQLPGGMGEDWDLLLRAAREHPVLQVDEPLVDVLWGSTSFFSRDWRMRLAANEWFLQCYPEISQHATGVARLTGQSAFFAAAARQRRPALRFVRRTLVSNPRELRAWLALLVIAVPRLGTTIMAALHRRGRGI